MDYSLQRIELGKWTSFIVGVILRIHPGAQLASLLKLNILIFSGHSIPTDFIHVASETMNFFLTTRVESRMVSRLTKEQQRAWD